MMLAAHGHGRQRRMSFVLHGLADKTWSMRANPSEAGGA
jgi:hypothetical protein